MISEISVSRLPCARVKGKMCIRDSPNADLDKKFCAEAAEAGFVNLKGHRLVGGMRASIYNAMPAEGVDCLLYTSRCV